MKRCVGGKGLYFAPETWETSEKFRGKKWAPHNKARTPWEVAKCIIIKMKTHR